MSDKKKKIEESTGFKTYTLNEDIILIEHISTKYDLNWFYMRLIILSLPNKFKSFWVIYENWFNFNFNKKTYLKKLIDEINNKEVE